MHKNLILILISCIFISFFLSACEPDENYELAFKKYYVDNEFRADNYRNPDALKSLYGRAAYPKEFTVTSGSDKYTVSVFPSSSVTSAYDSEIPGSGVQKIKDDSDNEVTMNKMILNLLMGMYGKPPTGSPWDLNTPTDSDVMTAILRTIMTEPQIAPRIQRDVQAHLRFKGVLVSGSDVVLSSIELSGGLYCLGELYLANGSKIVTDSKYIGECKKMYDSSPLMKKIKKGYSEKLPINIDNIPNRPQLFRYMEVNLEGHRNSTFSQIETELNTQSLDEILNKK